MIPETLLQDHYWEILAASATAIVSIIGIFGRIAFVSIRELLVKSEDNINDSIYAVSNSLIEVRDKLEEFIRYNNEEHAEIRKNIMSFEGRLSFIEGRSEIQPSSGRPTIS